MPLVQGKCQNCGGLLKVNPTQKMAVCKYCGTPYIVQEAINNYTTNIGNLQMNFHDGIFATARIEAAEAFLKLKKYDAARKTFEEASNTTPQYYQVWWGQIRAITKEFTEKIQSKSSLDELYSLYESALLFVPENKKETLEQQFQSFYQPLLEQNRQRTAALRENLQNLQAECESLDAAIEEWKAKEYSHAVRFANSGADMAVLLLFSVFLLMIVLLFGNAIFFLIWLIAFASYFIHDVIFCPISADLAAAEYEKKEKVLKDLDQQKNEAIEKISNAQQELDVLS